LRSFRSNVDLSRAAIGAIRTFAERK